MNESLTILELFSRAILVIDKFLVPLIFSIAFLFFIWGIFKYFIAGGDKTEAQESGRRFLVWSLAGFVIIIGIWGIINLILASLPFENRTRPPLPTFETPSERSND